MKNRLYTPVSSGVYLSGHPLILVFCASLLLSVIAYVNDPIINRDGILYIDTAKTFLNEGFLATFRRFDWPWFSLVIGASHWLTGLSLDLCARIWCSLFMAGTCCLTVACVRKHLPESRFLPCLVVLSMPAFNQYRGEVLREFGFWFFAILALWLVLRWQEKPGWVGAAFVHVAVLGAAAFRLEALILVPALFFWQVSSLFRDGDWLRLLQFNFLPLIGLLLGLTWVLIAGEKQLGVRIGEYLSLVDPAQLITKFNKISAKFGETILRKYSREDAGLILFFGMLMAAFFKFAKLLGPFAFPFLFKGAWMEVRNHWRSYLPFVWVWLFYFVMIIMFFLRRQFFLGRWVSFLDLLFVPFAIFGLKWLYDHHRKLAIALISIALFVMFDNVISLSAKKTHLIEAGNWLSANIRAGESIYYDDPRVSYYAGWGYPKEQPEREMILAPEHAGRYRYFVLEGSPDDQTLQQWLRQQHKQVLAGFASKRGDTLLIIGD